MTYKIINLRALVEKTPDADLLREMIGFAADRLVQLEVGVATGADYSEKSHSGRRTVADHRSIAQGFWGGLRRVTLVAASRLKTFSLTCVVARFAPLGDTADTGSDAKCWTCCAKQCVRRFVRA